ncbi:amino acid ABC transporter substrate-binding protein [Aestuariirhabdus sp. Z084]|uniref:amino acid ABC transporter substrate-binding protein n=1 Tax=Aestuariirhabdus haliotis TaxID=2918751 RepID=UPI00201B3804|nr:amino acid ABC transporter substrate-binding protein [Aestuariirhabdus haliotis]MCL6415701.1 amino acid ABC transporter substrate-binding protein [Aestuariirhabdus haliotis]MCL6419773.1 amino acid ABC transporter substrate-binding protein [Aestuariirhabdus haliotis]
MRFAIAAFMLVSMYFSTSANAADLTQTLKRIDKSGEINLGYRENEPPMSFHDPDGKPVGYTIDLCNLIVAGVKLKLERSDIKVNYVPVTAENRFSAVQSKEIDLLCGATTKTLSRSELVGFTQLTFVTGASMLSLTEKEVPSIKDLKGKRIAVVKNTTTLETIKNIITERLIDAEIVQVESAVEAMDMLDKSEIDAFSSDQAVLIGQIIDREGVKKYSLSKEMYSFEPFAIALQRGDADFQLVADRVLAQLYRSGQIGTIYNQWFGRFGEKAPMILQAMYQLNATPK